MLLCLLLALTCSNVISKTDTVGELIHVCRFILSPTIIADHSDSSHMRNAKQFSLVTFELTGIIKIDTLLSMAFFSGGEAKTTYLKESKENYQVNLQVDFRNPFKMPPKPAV